MDMTPIISVYVGTKHDVNGNPRRGWIAYNAEGDAVSFTVDDQAGPSGQSRRYPGVPNTYPMIPTTASEYNRLVRWENKRAQEGMYAHFVECTYCSFVGTNAELDEHKAKHVERGIQQDRARNNG